MGEYKSIYHPMHDDDPKNIPLGVGQAEFVTLWIERHGHVNNRDPVFHDLFHIHFGGKRKYHSRSGTKLVLKANRLLNKMTREGLLKRHRQWGQSWFEENS